MSVLIPDLDANRKILHSFIFGDYLEEGLSDGLILDGVDRLNDLEEKENAELENETITTSEGEITDSSSVQQQ